MPLAMRCQPVNVSQVLSGTIFEGNGGLVSDWRQIECRDQGKCLRAATVAMVRCFSCEDLKNACLRDDLNL